MCAISNTWWSLTASTKALFQNQCAPEHFCIRRLLCIWCTIQIRLRYFCRCLTCVTTWGQAFKASNVAGIEFLELYFWTSCNSTSIPVPLVGKSSVHSCTHAKHSKFKEVFMLPAVLIDYMVSNSGNEAGSNVLQTLPAKLHDFQNLPVSTWVFSSAPTATWRSKVFDKRLCTVFKTLPEYKTLLRPRQSQQQTHLVMECMNAPSLMVDIVY